jgi:hypothetical protein
VTFDSTTLDKASTTADSTIATFDAGDLESATLKGDQDFEITSVTAGTGMTEFDASGFEGDLTLDVSADVTGGGILVRGGSGDDTVTGTGDGSTDGDTFIMGEGSDAVTVDTGATVQRDSFVYKADSLGSGDVSGGDAETITGFQDATAAGAQADADVLDFTSGVEGELQDGGTVLGNANADVTIANGTTFGNDTNIAVEDVNAGADLRVSFDVNGDGSFSANDDFSITLTGQGGSALTYDASDDVFFIA